MKKKPSSITIRAGQDVPLGTPEELLQRAKGIAKIYVLHWLFYAHYEHTPEEAELWGDTSGDTSGDIAFGLALATELSVIDEGPSREHLTALLGKSYEDALRLRKSQTERAMGALRNTSEVGH